MSAAASIRLQDLVPAQGRVTREPLRPRSQGFAAHMDAAIRRTESAIQERQQMSERERDPREELSVGPATLAEAHKHHMARLKRELESAERLYHAIPGSSQLWKHIADSKVKLEQRLAAEEKNPSQGMEAAKLRMEMSQQLQMRYLAIQDKNTYPVTGTISNIMKKRSDSIRDMMRNL